MNYSKMEKNTNAKPICQSGTKFWETFSKINKAPTHTYLPIIPNEGRWECTTQILATGILGALNRITHELRALSIFREVTWFNI